MRGSRNVGWVVAACLVAGMAGPLFAAPAPPAPPARSAVEAALNRAGEEAGSPAPIQIVLVADKKDHRENEHDYPLWQQRWALLLGGKTASGAAQVNLFGPAIPDEKAFAGAENVTVAQASGWPTDEQFESGQVIVAFCYLAWNDARKQQMKRYIENGGGLVLIHSATWTKPKPDPEITGFIGVGGFSKFRHGPLRLTVVGDHPISRGLPKEIALLDEPYWPPIPPIDPAHTTILAVSEEEDPASRVASPQPMCWMTGTGKGRVFGCVPGHYTWTFDDPWFRLLLLRGIAWAAAQPPDRFDSLALRGARVNLDH